MYPGAGKAPAYDKAATLFSPDGRLYQVEYASKIVAQGTLGCGIIYADGILLAADKKISSRLLLPDSIEKLFKIDEFIGVVSAGLVGDARRLVQFAREKSQENFTLYDQPIHIETLVKEISAIKQAFTQYGGMRPFGVALIVGGIDDTGKRLFETEPSGALAEYKATAIGAGRKEAMKVFEDKYKENLTLQEALQLTLEAVQKTLPEKEKFESSRVEFATIEKGNKFTLLTQEQVKSYLKKK